MKKFPVDWKPKNMTSHITEEWLRAFNAKMKQQKHNIPFWDSATCHPHIKLSNV
jgi:hypothetical protein